jgi:hypothetical protein
MRGDRCRRALRRALSWLTAVGAIATLFCLGSAPATAADDLTVQVAPSSLTVEPADVVRVAVLVTNAARVPVRITRVDVSAPPHIAVETASGAVVSGMVPAGGSARGELELRVQWGFQDGEVAMFVEYEPTGSVRSVHQVAAAAVALKAGHAPAFPEVAFVSAPDKLNDGQVGRAVVRVVNPTPAAYRDITIAALGSDDIELDAVGASSTGACPPPQVPWHPIACLGRLLPGASALLDVRVRVHSSVRTGKQRIGIAFIGTRDTGPGGEQMPAAVVVGTADVELGVFGVDALSPFGIGTLFVLPGLLAVLVFLLLARVYPRTLGLPDTLGLKDLPALPFVVPAAAIAYGIVFWVLGRNLTERVSTFDVALLFVLGLGLGLVVWIVMVAFWQRLSGRKQFSVADSPDKVLKRLGARGARLTLPRFTANNLRYFYLTPGAGGKVLASPQLKYAFTPKMENDNAGRSVLSKAVGRGDIKAVRRARRRGEITIRWDAPTGVTTFDASDVHVADRGPLLDETQ